VCSSDLGGAVDIGGDNGWPENAGNAGTAGDGS